ncbi:TrkH family potassium uptake protein [soil metagenome]
MSPRSGKIINVPVVVNILGTLTTINGLMMLMVIPFALIYGDHNIWAILSSSAITVSAGLLMYVATKSNLNSEIKKREGFLIVTLGWLFMSLFGTLPFILSGAIPDFSDALFETVSGYTTTGASILDDIEAQSHSILFWRSTTHWIGGMGIIVLTIAILPLLGIGGMELFVAESPGPTKDKIHPRIKETAKRLWAIYMLLTLAETILLMFCGMDFFDAINHSFATIATGGFSTKQASLGFYNSASIEIVVTVFMFLAGTNFTVLYFLLKGRKDKIINNDEFRWYVFWILILGAMIVPAIVVSSGEPVGVALRQGFFQVVSIVTTTGFITSNYEMWGSFATMLFFLMMFSGASAGSTSGGFKIVRIVLLIKNGLAEFKRRLHPRAIIPIMMNKSSVPPSIIDNLLAFTVLYIMVFVVSVLVMTALGMNFMSSMGAVATCLNNVGPGVGTVGPDFSFSSVPDIGKVFLAFVMLLGRLELFTVLILFTPYLWKRY